MALDAVRATRPAQRADVRGQVHGHRDGGVFARRGAQCALCKRARAASGRLEGLPHRRVEPQGGV
eukprot:325872-Pleurochrysis_carterae.AAC.3